MCDSIWLLALACVGAAFLVAAPIWLLCWFAVYRFSDKDELTHIGQKRRIFR